LLIRIDPLSRAFLGHVVTHGVGSNGEFVSWGKAAVSELIDAGLVYATGTVVRATARGIEFHFGARLQVAEGRATYVWNTNEGRSSHGSPGSAGIPD
jgi:hypothetical protein